MIKHGAVTLTAPVRHWHCPCGRTSTTIETEPHAQLHPCRLARGLLTPYLPGEAGGGRVTVLERQDYEHHAGLRRGVSENLRRDAAGRPAMGVVVEHDGGAATALFVPGIEINMRLMA
jgi:hypothetical protein